MELTREILEELKKPFQEIQWRAGPKSQNRAMALAYIEARDVMDRLDEVIGGDWEFRWEVCREDVKGTLTVCGVTREDVGDAGEGDFKSLKSAVSDALKRCAVHFGVGRYLYRFPAQWVGYDPEKKRLTETPQVPEWAVPKHDPKTSLDEFVEKAEGYYKMTEDQVKAIIGDVEWTGSQEQRKEAHDKLREHNVS